LNLLNTAPQVGDRRIIVSDDIVKTAFCLIDSDHVKTPDFLT
jgi:hypothetical protein